MLFLRYDVSFLICSVVLLNIPVRPHVKKFLLHRFPQPYVLTDKHYIGSYLFSLLRRQRADPSFDHQIGRYSEIFEVNLKEYRIFDRGAINLTSHSIVHFNSFVDEIFKEKLYAYLDDVQQFDVEMKAGIECYMQKYSLLEGSDTTYDALKKAYWRYRKELQERISA